MSHLLDQHFSRIQRRLQAEGDAGKSLYHRTNKGFIREAFIKEFLDQNTSQFCGVGSGEIIHQNSKSSEERNQIDIILYNNRYPKISIASGIDLFFIETVSSFIEVKSSLTKDELRKAAKASKKIKSYPNSATQTFNPNGRINSPRPYSFVFSYDCTTANIGTILKWMKELSEEDDYNIEQLKRTPPDKRNFFPNLFVDGVFVLGKGYIIVDASPFESPLSASNGTSLDHIWIYSTNGEMQVLWAAIVSVGEALFWNSVDLAQYFPAKKRLLSD